MRRRSLHFSSSDEELVVKEILLTHVSDSLSVDSKSLLHVIENIVFHDCISNRAPIQETKVLEDEVAVEAAGICGSVAQIIYRLSFQVMERLFREGGTYETMMSLFDSLGNHPWGAKVVLMLTAFAKSYGEYLLIAQLYHTNPRENPLAIFKQIPRITKDAEALEPCFKALNCLLKTMINIIKGIIILEDFPKRYTKQNLKEMAATKVLIHVAAYWVARSAVACFSVFIQLTARTHEELTGTSVKWELWSLIHKMVSVHNHVRERMDAWDQYIEINVGKELVHLFEEIHDDNQEVLDIFLSMKDSPRIWEGLSAGKIGLDVLKNKVVILLITKLDISLRQLLCLVHQINSYSEDKSDGSYEIVWIPIPSSGFWTSKEEKIFSELASHLPWYSISQPWCLRQVVEKYIKESWNFEHDPLMVVLDHQGRVICPNAINMITIWGSTAYPFSSSREEQLWEEESWSMGFIMRGIDPLASMWSKEGKTICLYGSNNLEWTRQFASQIVSLNKAGGLIEQIYVGTSNPGEKIGEILATITEQKLGCYLPEAKMYLFWSRLMSMRNSGTRLTINQKGDVILREVVSLLNWDADMDSWALIGDGSSDDPLKLEGTKAMELLALYNTWGHNAGKIGLLNAMKLALNPPLPPSDLCGHIKIIHFSEGSKERNLLCKKCSSPMEKCTLYQCNGRELE